MTSKSIKNLKPTICNVCGGVVRLVKTNKGASGYAYVCESCGARVGTFPKNIDVAMGLLADKETSTMRVKVHRLFDRFWKNNLQRKQMYQKLAIELGINESECHFAYMTFETLQQCEQILLKWWRDKYDI